MDNPKGSNNTEESNSIKTVLSTFTPITPEGLPEEAQYVARTYPGGEPIWCINTPEIRGSHYIY